MASRIITNSSINVEKTDLDDSSKSSNVKVVVRVRPPNEKEKLCGKASIVKVIDDHMLTFDPKEDEYTVVNSSKPRINVLEKRMRDLHFAFDRVFNGNASNKQVFQYTTKEVLDSIFDGYNCSVFAYGATSAGKTHTMLGSTEEPGVIFLTMMELYSKLNEKSDNFEIDISVSYLEIYNETCKDLLLPTGPLAVREDPDKGVCVNGLSLHKPRSAEELLEMLHFGNRNRTQHPTDANKQSSRSHAVFQVFVKQSPKITGLSASVKLSKISLIDLAGSERATVTSNRGERLREGANINKSLLALGNCINALAENKSNYHIPYRNSKLTRLLKDSLGGNCKTIMIAAVSPSSISYEDTYNTLKYANRAKNIKSNLSVNTVSVDYHVTQYAKIVEDLKSQISSLQLQLSEKGNDRKVVYDEETEKNNAILERFDAELSSIYKEKLKFKHDLIQCEANERKLQQKLAIKEKGTSQDVDVKNQEKYFNLSERLSGLNFISSNDEKDTSQDVDAKNQHGGKIETCRQETQQNLSQLKEQKTRLQASLDENRLQMSRLQNEIDLWANGTNDDMRMRVNLMYEVKQNSMENFYLRKQASYWEKCCKTQAKELEKQERLASNFVGIMREQRKVIECYKSEDTENILLSVGNLDNAIEELAIQLEGNQKISWADQSMVANVTAVDSSGVVSNFSSCTPFKTPSRKPSILRQMVLESRQKLTPETLKPESTCTERNTALNTGPIRSKLVFTEKERNKVLENDKETFNDTVDTINDTLMQTRGSETLDGTRVLFDTNITQPQGSSTVVKTKSKADKKDGNNVLNETRVISRELTFASPNKDSNKRRQICIVSPTPAKLDGTFSMPKRAKQDSLDDDEIEVPLTPISPEPNESESIKSHIPVRTPLKSFNQNATKTTTQTRSRIRSFTTGNHTFVVPSYDQNSWKSNDDSALNTTYKVEKTGIPGYTKSAAISNMKRKRYNLGPPSRSYTNLDFSKENNKYGGHAQQKSRLTKSTHSVSTSSFKKTSFQPLEKARFRF